MSSSRMSSIRQACLGSLGDQPGVDGVQSAVFPIVGPPDLAGVLAVDRGDDGLLGGLCGSVHLQL